MRQTILIAAIAAVLCSQTILHAQSRTERGAVNGGLAGAILGGIAGHQKGDTAEGVAIGALVGAVAGGAIGNADDRQARENYQYQLYRQQQLAQQQQLQQARLQQAISIGDAITMTRSGISDNLIISQIRTSGVQQKIGVQEIVMLHQNGVSEPVIQAMQTAPIGGTSIAAQTTPTITYPAVPQPSSTIIVERRPAVIVQPYVPRPRYYHPHQHYPSRHATFEWHYRR